MPLEDYSHWNEEAERIWWEEEGKHETYERPNDDDGYYEDHPRDWEE